jgi:hypothetical protein
MLSYFVVAILEIIVLPFLLVSSWECMDPQESNLANRQYKKREGFNDVWDFDVLEKVTKMCLFYCSNDATATPEGVV